MRWLSRLVELCRRPPAPDLLKAVLPIVTPDPDAAAALARRRAELDYTPTVGFLRDMRQERVPQ